MDPVIEFLQNFFVVRAGVLEKLLLVDQTHGQALAEGGSLGDHVVKVVLDQVDVDQDLLLIVCHLFASPLLFADVQDMVVTLIEKKFVQQDKHPFLVDFLVGIGLGSTVTVKNDVENLLAVLRFVPV